MSQRLQKVIAQSGFCSRRKAEDLITSGRVRVNGHVVDTLGAKVGPSDTIQVDQKVLKLERPVTYMINKPTQTLSSVTNDRGLVNVVDLIDDDRRLFPVGRLDYYTSGLLLITNDGQLSHALTHPSSHLEKCYHVKIRGSLQDWQKEALEKGLTTKDESYLPVQVKNLRVDPIKKQSHFDLVLVEGKNRQIRKMMEFFHHEVLRLSRQSIGFLKLGTLASGRYRKLSQEEIDLLKYWANKERRP